MVTSHIGLVVAASGAIDLCAAMLVLFCAWARGHGDDRPAVRVTLIRVLAAAIVVSLIFYFKAALLTRLGLNFFGLVHIVYVDLVVVLPLAGAVVVTLWLRGGPAGRPVSPVALVIAVLALMMAPLGVYATFIEPFRLRVETPTVVVPEARAGREPIRIGVLADIQTSRITEYEHEAVDRLMALSPDIVFVPGDLWQGMGEELRRELPALRGLLGRLTAPGGAYFVHGNCDDWPTIKQVLAGTPVRLLHNEVVSIRVRDRRISIGGLGLFRSGEAEATLQRLEQEPGDEDIRILLTHRPDPILRIGKHSRIDLMVAGHTHGGQICLPFLGPLTVASAVPRTIGAGGLHELDGRRIYVSRGVGFERDQAPRIRFLCPPEIALIAVTSSSSRTR